VGDHKYIWELNRHQHLVVLAQAYNLTGKPEYIHEAIRQVESWLDTNPPLRGINWSSALETAFRALSWVWLDRLAGPSLPAHFRRGLLSALYLHGCFVERNLSIYFSPNTHLLGEAVALYTLGAIYPDFPASARWRKLGSRLVEEQMERQVREDGAHFEQSSYYHVYALDFFLWYDLLGGTSARYKERLLRMAEYLDALLGPGDGIPLIGDDDGGRLFHPYGERAGFGRTTLADCGIRFNRPDWVRSVSAYQPQSRLFPASGMAVMAAGDVQILIKAGGFGPSTAGHSHSDVLSFVCRRGAEWLLVDSGTYSYLDPVWRDRFRGSAAHNTIRIDGKDQAAPESPFRWGNRPEVRIGNWATGPERDFLEAECRYAGFVHRRRFEFRKPDLLLVVDEVEGPAGEHLVEQFWHAANESVFAGMAFSQPAEAREAWHSSVYGSKEPGAAKCVSYRGVLPVSLTTTIRFD
jgi:hypothetical protein